MLDFPELLYPTIGLKSLSEILTGSHEQKLLMTTSDRRIFSNNFVSTATHKTTASSRNRQQQRKGCLRFNQATHLCSCPYFGTVHASVKPSLDTIPTLTAPSACSSLSSTEFLHSHCRIENSADGPLICATTTGGTTSERYLSATTRSQRMAANAHSSPSCVSHMDSGSGYIFMPRKTQFI